MFVGQHRRPVVAASGRPAAAPHPDRQVDLQLGQAGVGHAVLQQRQCLSRGGAGAVPARGLVDHRLRHRRARRRGRRSTCAATTSASTCRPRRTRLGLLPDDAAQPTCIELRDERRRGAQVHHLDGRGRSRRPPASIAPPNRSDLATASARRRLHNAAWQSAMSHAYNHLLRPRQRSADGPDRHPDGLGPPPPRPRRRDLHRPARPRRPGAGRLRPRPRRDVRDRRGRAQRVLPEGRRQGARAPGRHRERQPHERQGRGAVPRARGAEPERHAAVPARRREPVARPRA